MRAHPERAQAARERLVAHIAKDAAGKMGRAEQTDSGTLPQRTDRTPTRRTYRLQNALAQLVAGLVVLAALFPISGAATIPSQCSGVLGYTVPCGPWFALVAGAAAAGLVRLLINRR